MNAWSADPIPAQYLQGPHRSGTPGRSRFPGQAVPQLPCARRGRGQTRPGARPVALRLTRDQLIRQVIQGGGNMPAYGKNLKPAETTALVAFLETLHPAGQAPARDASLDILQGAGLDRSSATGTKAGR